MFIWRDIGAAAGPAPTDSRRNECDIRLTTTPADRSEALQGEWAGRLCSGLQIRVDRFDSGTRLHALLPKTDVCVELPLNW